jgi:hypothetical protein
MELDLGNLVAAVGSLGVASYALVDVSKIGRHGGVSKASRRLRSGE